MNLFETVKGTITVKQAAEYYGLTAGRNGMVCCPFHNDRHPSMKLNEDYIEHLADVLTVAELEQRVTAVNLLMKEGSIVELEKRLNRLKKEVKSHGKEQELNGSWITAMLRNMFFGC